MVTTPLVDAEHRQHAVIGAEASDMLKYFSERIPATFVYAGVDIERAGLLSGTRGEQIAGRFGMIRATAFPRGEHRTGLIAALEHALRLHRHKTGTLVALDDYLHLRTTGMIGSLLRLIRSAAIQAVLDGTEQITPRHPGLHQRREEQHPPALALIIHVGGRWAFGDADVDLQ